MGCCKCEKYGWKDEPPLEVVWIDEEQKGYCLFHAPKEKKRKRLGSDEEVNSVAFDELVGERINLSMSLDSNENLERRCNLKGLIAPWLFDVRYFKVASYNCDLDFRYSVFCGDAYFSSRKYNGKVLFDHTVFESEAYFELSEFYELCDFKDVTFTKYVSFSNSTFFKGVSFYGSIFLNISDFMSVTFSERAVFISAKFNGIAMFNYASFPGTIDLTNISTSCDLNVRMLSIEQISLENIIFSCLELPSILFRNSISPEVLGIEKHEEYPYELSDYEHLYRAMKQRATEEHDQRMVSWWHYREKLQSLKQQSGIDYRKIQLRTYKKGKVRGGLRRCWLLIKLKTPVPLRSATWLYWATSGFGERAVRAGVWLLALLGLSFFANSIKEPWVWSELPGSAAVQYTLDSIPFAKDIQGYGWVRAARGFWQFLIAVQFTLFALAVRNRFRR